MGPSKSATARWTNGILCEHLSQRGGELAVKCSNVGLARHDPFRSGF
jgi:hypothetical protein